MIATLLGGAEVHVSCVKGVIYGYEGRGMYSLEKEHFVGSTKVEIDMRNGIVSMCEREGEMRTIYLYY